MHLAAVWVRVRALVDAVLAGHRCAHSAEDWLEVAHEGRAALDAAIPLANARSGGRQERRESRGMCAVSLRLTRHTAQAPRNGCEPNGEDMPAYVLRL